MSGANILLNKPGFYAQKGETKDDLTFIYFVSSFILRVIASQWSHWRGNLLRQGRAMGVPPVAYKATRASGRGLEPECCQWQIQRGRRVYHGR